MIEVKHLTKRYGAHTAVSDLSFTISPGSIYGFLGPNGAGKSTTMNIIAGCLAATDGEVKIGDYDIFDQPIQAKRLIGYLPEIPPLYTDMTPKEYLRFVMRIKGVSPAETREEMRYVMQKTGIEDVQNRLIRNLSKGFRQRVGIAQALCGHPQAIILDEPTVGLDPLQIIEIRELIRELKRDHTVILSSHILSEVSAICDEIMIISKGHLVACDTPDMLTKRLSAGAAVNLKIRGARDAILSALNTVKGLGAVRDITEADGVCSLKADMPEDVCEAIFTSCADAGLPILMMDTERASLEDVFLELTTGDAPPILPPTPEAESTEGGDEA